MIGIESILTLKPRPARENGVTKEFLLPAAPLGNVSQSFPAFLEGHQVVFCSITTFFTRESDKHLHTELKVAINSPRGIAF